MHINDNRGPEIMAAIIIVAILAALSVFLRLACRRYTKCAISWDEYFILAGLVRTGTAHPGADRGENADAERSSDWVCAFARSIVSFASPSTKRRPFVSRNGSSFSGLVDGRGRTGRKFIRHADC